MTSARGLNTIVSVYKKGEFLAEAELFENKPSLTAMIALNDCVVAVAVKENLQQLLFENTVFLRRILRSVSLRLRESWQQAYDSHICSTRKKVEKKLLRLANDCGIKRGRGRVIKISHQELAEMIGIARESVSRSLSSLKREGILQTRHGSIFVSSIQL